MRKNILMIFCCCIVNTAQVFAQGLTGVSLVTNLGNRQFIGLRADSVNNSYLVMSNDAADSSFVEKRDPSGNLLWQKVWPSPFNVKIAQPDHTGRVYVIGDSNASFDMNPDAGISNSNSTNAMIVVCLDAGGNFIWGRTTRQIPGFFGRCNFIDADRMVNGGLVVYGDWVGSVDINPDTATFQPTAFLQGSSDGAFLLRLDTLGNTSSINSIESSCCEKNMVRCAANGNTAVAFTTSDSLVIYSNGVYTPYAYTASNQNYCVAEFDAAGNLSWKSDLINGGFSAGTRICYDPFDNLYISGVYGNDTDLDPGAGVDTTTVNLGGTLFLMKLDAFRNREWIKMIETGYFYNSPGLLAVNTGQELFISGDGTNDGYTGGNLPDYSPVLSPGLITLGNSNAAPYLAKLNACGELEWARFGPSLPGPAVFNEEEVVVIAGNFQNNVDLDPDPNSTQITSGSPVNENVVLMFFSKTEYCKPVAYNGTSASPTTFIADVRLASIQDSLAGFAGVNSYTLSATGATLLTGGNYHLRVIGQQDSASAIAAWIDWNGDLTFESNESLGLFTTNGQSDTADFFFSLPFNFIPIQTRLRIRNVCCEAVIDPCCNYSNGQTIDYPISIGQGVVDLNIQRLDNPLAVFCPDSISPVVWYENMGSLPVSSFQTSLQINGSTYATVPVTTLLAPGDSVSVIFPSFNFIGGANYTITAIVDTVNGLPDSINNSYAVTTFNVPVFTPLTANCTIEAGLTGMLQYNWYFNGVVLAGAPNSSVLVPAANGNYTLEVITPDGCKAAAADTIAFAFTQANLVASALSVCDGDSVLLSADGGTSYQWNLPGADTSSSIVFAPDSPTIVEVYVTNESGCVDTSSVSVDWNPMPAGSISGNTSYCEGDTAQLLAVYPSASIFLWSDGSTSASFQQVQNLAGNYLLTVIITDTLNCESVDSIPLSVNPGINGSIIGDTAICEGEDLALSAAYPGASSYFWSTGSSGTDSLIVSGLSAGNYNFSVQVVNAFGCTTSGSANVAVAALPQVTQLTGSGSCAGDTLPIQLVLPIGSSVIWCDGTTAASISLVLQSPSTSTCYTVTDTATLCSVFGNPTIAVNPAPPTPVIQVLYPQGNPVLVASPPGFSPAWYSNGLIVANTDSLFNPAIGSGYQLQLTNSFGCTALSGNLVFTSLADIPGPDLLVYPNPFNEQVILEFGNGPITEDMQADLYDATGRLVMPYTLTRSSVAQYVFSTSSLANGIYLINIRSATYSRAIRLLKQP